MEVLSWREDPDHGQQRRQQSHCVCATREAEEVDLQRQTDLWSVSPAYTDSCPQRKAHLIPWYPILGEKIVGEPNFLEQSVAVGTLHTANASAYMEKVIPRKLRTLTAPTKSSSPVPSPGRYNFNCVVGGFVRRSSGKIASAMRAMFVKLCSSV